MSHFTLITGGARSGKSSFAERLAVHLGLPVIYIATAQVLDDEMAVRVQKHRERRPADWQLIEEPLHIPEVLQKLEAENAVILLDCVTIWLSNLMLHSLESHASSQRFQSSQSSKTDHSLSSQGLTPETETSVLDQVRKAAVLAQEITPHVIMVTNEVGQGVVPDNPLARSYRDLAGRANQLLSRYADEVYWVVAGYPVEIKASGQAILNSLKSSPEHS